MTRPTRCFTIRTCARRIWARWWGRLARRCPPLSASRRREGPRDGDAGELRPEPRLRHPGGRVVRTRGGRGVARLRRDEGAERRARRPADAGRLRELLAFHAVWRRPL